MFPNDEVSGAPFAATARLTAFLFLSMLIGHQSIPLVGYLQQGFALWTRFRSISELAHSSCLPAVVV
jgi:hypothetical protein